MALCEQALGCLAHLPQTRERTEAAIDLRFSLQNSLNPLGELEAMFGHLQEAERLAGALGDQLRLGRSSVYMSQYFYLTDNLTETLRLAQRANTIAGATRDFPLEIEANVWLGHAHLARGDYREAERFLRAVTGALEGGRGRERLGSAWLPGAVARALLAACLAEQGQFTAGIQQAKAGLNLAKAVDDRYSVAIASRGLAYVHGAQGQFADAARVLERGVALAREWDLTVMSLLLTRHLGYVYAMSDRVDEGLALLHHVAKTFESMPYRVHHSTAFAQLGEACLLAHRVDEATAWADRALQRARDRGERGGRAYGLRLLGEIAARRGSPAASVAEHHYHEALALAGELGMQPLGARCHLDLGRLHRDGGQRHRAEEHLTTAVRMFGEMGMPFWLERAEAEFQGLE